MIYKVIYGVCFVFFFLGCTSQSQEGNPVVSNEEKQVPINFLLDSLLTFDSEAALAAHFGQENVKRTMGYYPEGMGEYQQTLLFPSTKNEVFFVWADDTATFSQLLYVSVVEEGTAWKTREGITVGTSIQDLEQYNQQPFVFYGFEWDYEGAVDWKGGQLEKRKVGGKIIYKGDPASDPNYEKLLGDVALESNSELASQNPYLILGELSLAKD